MFFHPASIGDAPRRPRTPQNQQKSEWFPLRAPDRDPVHFPRLTEKIKQHLGPQGPNFIKILVFGGFEGSGGAWGHHQSTRDEKTSSASYFRDFWLDL